MVSSYPRDRGQQRQKNLAGSRLSWLSLSHLISYHTSFLKVLTVYIQSIIIDKTVPRHSPKSQCAKVYYTLIPLVSVCIFLVEPSLTLAHDRTSRK